MKRIIKLIFTFFIILLVIQILFGLFKTKHKINYTMHVDDKDVIIDEEYYKKTGNYYLFNIIIDQHDFTFDVKNYFNKQKQIIKDIKIFEQDDLMCIYPILIKNKKNTTIACNLDNKQVTYTSIKDQYDLKDFIQNIPNYNEDAYINNQKIEKINNNQIYIDNLKKEEILLLYEYNDLLKVTNKKNTTISFADYDIYNNDLGVLVGKYYILPKYEKLPLYNKLLIIDIIKNKTSELDLELSTNLYINGIIDNKLYLLDKSNLKLYEINPKKKNYQVVGNTQKEAKFYSDGWTVKNIYEIANNNLTFTYNYPIKDEYVKAFENEKYYYYYNKDYEFYKVLKILKKYN